MDPNAALKMIANNEPGTEEHDESLECLSEWLTFGGFAPNWAAYPKASALYFAYAAKLAS